jgi:hypothetical protein
VSAGYRGGQIGNTGYRASTAVLYGGGAQPGADEIASLLGATAVSSAAVPAGHVQILLGAGARVPTIPPVSQPSPSSSGIPSTGPQGGAVAAKNGIPCVN